MKVAATSTTTQMPMRTKFPTALPATATRRADRQARRTTFRSLAAWLHEAMGGWRLLNGGGDYRRSGAPQGMPGRALSVVGTNDNVSHLHRQQAAVVDKHEYE